MKRKKNEKSFSKSYGPVVIWKDDLEQIVEALGGDVAISNDDYTFNSIDDAAQNFLQKPQFTLNLDGCSPPYAEVDFRPTSTKVRVTGGANSTSIYHELDEILTRCQRRASFLYSMWIPPVAVLTSAAMWIVPTELLPLWAIVPLTVFTV